MHWLRPASPEGLATRDPLAMASFPLLPFCNRIRDGRAHFEGRDIRFPPNHPAQPSPHPLHGIGWLRPWELISASDTEALLSIDVAASPAWPWHFSAGQRYTLTPSGLRVSLVLRNEDSAEEANRENIGVTYDEMRPGCYDPKARLADMDINHTQASLAFPSMPRFCGQMFHEQTPDDRDLGLALVRAYNDWMVEEWCGDSAGRLIPLCVSPLWDADQAAAERVPPPVRFRPPGGLRCRSRASRPPRRPPRRLRRPGALPPPPR